MRIIPAFHKKTTTVWACCGDGCDAVLVLRASKSKSSDGADGGTPRGNASSDSPVAFSVDEDGIPLKHEKCPGGDSGHFQAVTVWHCQYCHASISPSVVPSQGQGTETVKSKYFREVVYTYNSGRPFVHVNCSVLEELGKEFRLHGKDKSHCFYQQRSDLNPFELLRRRREKVIGDGHGQPVPGLDELGKGVLMPGLPKADGVSPEMEEIKPYIKNHLIDVTKQYCMDVAKREPLFRASDALYVPEGINADKEGIRQPIHISAGDTRTTTSQSKAIGGLSVVPAGSMASVAAMKEEIEKATAGEKTITCTIHYEVYRLWLNPPLGDSGANIVDTFKVNRAVEDLNFSNVYGTHFVEEVYAGGKLTLWLTKYEGQKQTEANGRIGMSVDPGDAISVDNNEESSSIQVAASVNQQGGLMLGASKIRKKKEGPQLYDCTIQRVGGDEIAATSLSQKPLDELIQAVDTWKQSVIELKNLQPLRLTLAEHSKIHYSASDVPLWQIRNTYLQNFAASSLRWLNKYLLTLVVLSAVPLAVIPVWFCTKLLLLVFTPSEVLQY